MAGAAAASDVVHFSVRARPDGDRHSAVRDFYGLSATGRAFLRHGFDPAPDRALYIDGAMRSYPGLGLVGLACSSARTERTRQEVQDDDLWLNVTLAGRRAVWHCGREAEFGDGEALLSTGSRASRNAFTDTRFISFRVPRKPMVALVPNVEDMICVPIRHDMNALRLLASYGATLMDDTLSSPSPEMQRLSVNHVYDLIAVALGATHDATEVAKGRGVRAARLQAIKADIQENLCGDLSVGAIAARHRLPVRYLQRLFEEDGATFIGYVIEQRLAHVHRLLRNQRLANLKISAVAAEAGFNNLSHFNQIFRRRYGASPSDVRDQASREHRGAPV
jgi:AraC-like DNA-binding protein